MEFKLPVNYVSLSSQCQTLSQVLKANILACNLCDNFDTLIPFSSDHHECLGSNN